MKDPLQGNPYCNRDGGPSCFYRKIEIAVVRQGFFNSGSDFEAGIDRSDTLRWIPPTASMLGPCAGQEVIPVGIARRGRAVNDARPRCGNSKATAHASGKTLRFWMLVHGRLLRFA